MSDNQIKKSKKDKKGKKGKKGKKSKCYWRLMVPCPENPDNLIPFDWEDDEHYEFEDAGIEILLVD